MKEHPLALKIKPYMSEKRYIHTLGVVKMAEKLSRYCLPDKRDALVAAAFLHDISKELSFDEQKRILACEGVTLDGDEMNSPEIFHSFTAPYVIKRDFPEYASEEILNAVRYHTVGDVDMTVFDEIIFLSDYIEEGRVYQSCIDLRNYVLENMGDDIIANVVCLHNAALRSIEATERVLLAKGKRVSKRTALVKKSLASKI
ncbi:MAG: bis(5'-nucleosyl)-tetraphosphatase (symmetrical) YqeK [Clostridia bacterium]|nr:bis(5'-nucleosyl)-tetraphosphatase (symmetrical) YqeK [Clostridia bacterium]